VVDATKLGLTQSTAGLHANSISATWRTIHALAKHRKVHVSRLKAIFEPGNHPHDSAMSLNELELTEGRIFGMSSRLYIDTLENFKYDEMISFWADG